MKSARPKPRDLASFDEAVTAASQRATDAQATLDAEESALKAQQERVTQATSSLREAKVALAMAQRDRERQKPLTPAQEKMLLAIMDRSTGDPFTVRHSNYENMGEPTMRLKIIGYVLSRNTSSGGSWRRRRRRKPINVSEIHLTPDGLAKAQEIKNRAPAVTSAPMGEVAKSP